MVVEVILVVEWSKTKERWSDVARLEDKHGLARYREDRGRGALPLTFSLLTAHYRLAPNRDRRTHTL